MGRKELVLINLAPASSSSPCLLTGLLVLVLPSRCAPSLQVELVLLASFSCCCLRVGGAGASGPACWRRGQRGNEQRESQAITQAKQDLVVYLPVMCAAFGVMRGPRRRPDELARAVARRRSIFAAGAHASRTRVAHVVHDGHQRREMPFTARRARPNWSHVASGVHWRPLGRKFCSSTRASTTERRNHGEQLCFVAWDGAANAGNRSHDLTTSEKTQGTLL